MFPVTMNHIYRY